jgi:hypothetical protein
MTQPRGRRTRSRTSNKRLSSTSVNSVADDAGELGRMEAACYFVQDGWALLDEAASSRLPAPCTCMHMWKAAAGRLV